MCCQVTYDTMVTTGCLLKHIMKHIGQACMHVDTHKPEELLGKISKYSQMTFILKKCLSDDLFLSLKL